jgi:hypothetical protein
VIEIPGLMAVSIFSANAWICAQLLRHGDDLRHGTPTEPAGRTHRP